VITRIDHIVIGVQDLDQAVADYETLGFTVVPGGTHTGGETHNALIGFADGTYFELIAFVDPSAPSDHRWHAAIANGEGVIDFAVGTDDATAEADRIAGEGVANDGAVDGGRERPDGQLVAWRNLVVPGALEAGAPFIIEDRTARDLRVPSGADTMHPGGFQAVDGLTVVVDDLQAARRLFTTLLDDDGNEVEPSVAGAGAAYRFPVGDQWVELVTPDERNSRLRMALNEHGPAPYTVLLRTTDRSFAGEDMALTHGARFELKQ
jgi:catechol 2,3-dioxygenase-like lactoylglutathione lyase family enzyme